MSRINKFEDWKDSDKMNEEVSVLALQIGVILGILGWKGLKALVFKIAKEIGSKTKDEIMTKDELKKVSDGMIKRIEKMNQSDISLTKVKSTIKDQIEREEIRTLNDMIEYFKKNT